jgi:preprotein translocase subunit YajC
MTINLVIYSGIALIILGVILYGVSCFMIKRIQKREREINRYIFEILRPKPKGKK